MFLLGSHFRCTSLMCQSTGLTHCQFQTDGFPPLLLHSVFSLAVSWSCCSHTFPGMLSVTLMHRCGAITAQEKGGRSQLLLESRQRGWQSAPSLPAFTAATTARTLSHDHWGQCGTPCRGPPQLTSPKGGSGSSGISAATLVTEFHVPKNVNDTVGDSC